jgi:hypothetical protein
MVLLSFSISYNPQLTAYISPNNSYFTFRLNHSKLSEERTWSFGKLLFNIGKYSILVFIGIVAGINRRKHDKYRYFPVFFILNSKAQSSTHKKRTGPAIHVMTYNL